VTEVIHNLVSHTVGTLAGTPETALQELICNKNPLKTSGVPRPGKVLREKKNIGCEKLYHALADLAITVRSLYPESATRNPFKRAIPFHGQPMETVWLFDQLVHAVTMINRVERYQDKSGSWTSERSDVLAALQLMKCLINPELLLTASEKDTHRILAKYIGTEKTFGRKDVQALTGLGKTHSTRQINKLLQSGLVKMVGGHKNRGYLYRLA
jgi:hypothetical protein